jgi:hypothetical protein
MDDVGCVMVSDRMSTIRIFCLLKKYHDDAKLGL